jgi:hypothetical protein
MDGAMKNTVSAKTGANDVAAYREYLKANASRVDVGPMQIHAEIAKVDARLADPKFAHKHDYYTARLGELQAVLRVMEA